MNILLSLASLSNKDIIGPLRIFFNPFDLLINNFSSPGLLILLSLHLPVPFPMYVGCSKLPYILIIFDTIGDNLFSLFENIKPTSDPLLWLPSGVILSIQLSVSGAKIVIIKNICKLINKIFS